MHKFVVCMDNAGYEASLELRKLYEVVADPDAQKYHQIRVIDESGEDYLFSKELFIEAHLSEVVSQKVAAIGH